MRDEEFLRKIANRIGKNYLLSDAICEHYLNDEEIRYILLNIGEFDEG